jgi:hypothetical protein
MQTLHTIALFAGALSFIGAALAQTTGGCGCEHGAAPVTAAAQTAPSAPSTPQPAIDNLVPLAAVIVGGCESCAEKMVARALSQGSSVQDIDRALRAIEQMRKLECFAQAVGPETLARMEKPLAAGRRALQQTAPAQAR